MISPATTTIMMLLVAMAVISTVDAFLASHQYGHAAFLSSRPTLSAFHPFMTTSPTTSGWEFFDDLPPDNSDNDDKDDMNNNNNNKNQDKERRLLQEDDGCTFKTGDDLHLLRQKVLGMRHELERARKQGSMRRIRELEHAILEAQQVDAEFVYSVNLEKMEAAQRMGLTDEAEHYSDVAMKARNAMPHFQLSGLWVGKYGDHGYEMINVTYVGDTLIAYKVTGEKTVPKGEISFQVDLSPRGSSSHQDDDEFGDQEATFLEPIELGDVAANQWGSKYLHRFAGKGQVSAEGYINSQWVEGQLILVKEYFSFAWLPIGHQVFFGRPSAELVLKLLRESQASTQMDESRLYLERCMEETAHLEDEYEVSDGVFSSPNQQDYYAQDGCFE